MPLELLTLNDLQQFKEQLIQELKDLLQPEDIQYMKSREVCKMLRISAGTLQTMRKNNEIPFTKKRGFILYERNEMKQWAKRRER